MTLRTMKEAPTLVDKPSQETMGQSTAFHGELPIGALSSLKGVLTKQKTAWTNKCRGASTRLGTFSENWPHARLRICRDSRWLA